MTTAFSNIKALKRVCGIVAVVGICIVVGQAGRSDLQQSTVIQDIKGAVGGGALVGLAWWCNARLDRVKWKLKRICRQMSV